MVASPSLRDYTHGTWPINVILDLTLDRWTTLKDPDGCGPDQSPKIFSNIFLNNYKTISIYLAIKI